jgi:hypothetical protein
MSQDDFEVIESPSTTSYSPEIITPATTTPANEPSEINEAEQSIRDLFRNVDNTNNFTPAQYASKALVYATLPFVIAWTATTTLVTLEYLAFKNHRGISDDKILEKVLNFLIEDIEKCRKQLRWIEEEMPKCVERYCADALYLCITFWLTNHSRYRVQMLRSKASVYEASVRARQSASETLLPRTMVAVAVHATYFSIVAAVAMSLVCCGWLRLWPPVWIAFGYWLKSRRGRMGPCGRFR